MCILDSLIKEACKCIYKEESSIETVSVECICKMD